MILPKRTIPLLSYSLSEFNSHPAKKKKKLIMNSYAK